MTIPAEGHPAKYHFAGTPMAGIQSRPARCWTPAFAGVVTRAGMMMI